MARLHILFKSLCGHVVKVLPHANKNNHKVDSHADIDKSTSARFYLDWCDKNFTIAGGPESVVEIDEALARDYWVFRNYEISTKNIFVVKVVDQSKESLLCNKRLDNAWNNNNL
ncbi:hypothetical protein RF11_10421 [Thelohanellus kitauei]|uniref:Uncharacterized protein n=1 Tax=Thelohanellus kitauei TaxID=669202 RepID=A0A0C2JZP8_THEKT|nr:hypothetical protein RF11_10421 [Thelohanellus kitauei]